MSLLVFITGKQGAGKSYLADKWARSNQARHIDVDRILVAGGKELLNSASDDATDWHHWKNASPEMRESCLRFGLNTEYGQLEGSAADFVVEGGILCNAWFFEPMLAALSELLSVDPVDPVVATFYLNVSNATILRNVHKRAGDNPKQRGNETRQFRTELDVAKMHLEFDDAVKRSAVQWMDFSSSESLEVALNGLLSRKDNRSDR